MILLIDNFDSFTYNLYQFLGELGVETKVVRNNQVSIKQIEDLKPSAIILSPGPGKPEDAGVCVELVQKLYKTIPILGICLGHQAIGAAFGAIIKNAKNIKHGKASMIMHNGKGLFEYLSTPLEVMRYHSLSIDIESLSQEMECIAKSMEDNEIMAIRHRHYPVFGLQFHPESIGTPSGKQILKNFLSQMERNDGNARCITSIG